MQPKVTATRNTAGPKKPKPKSTAATKPAAGKPKKKAAASVKTEAEKNPNFHLPTRGHLESPRTLLHPSMCGADKSVPHIHLLPPHGGSTPMGCLEDRYFLGGRILPHALGGRYGVKPCASPAGTRTELAAGSLNWSIFSASTVSIFVS